MKLVVTHRSEYEGDFSLGCLDERPAVGDGRGRWYEVTGDAVIHNEGERLVWICKREHGIWECIHEMHWQDQYVDPKERWIKAQPDYLEAGSEDR